MTRTEHHRAVFALLDASRFSEAEVNLRYEQAVNPDYWLNLNPSLSISPQFLRVTQEANPLSPDTISAQAQQLREIGYFHSGPVIDISLTRNLAQAMSTLSPREQEILSLFYFEQLTKQEIATKLRVKYSRISQIHSAAITKLRTHFEAKKT